MKINKVISLLSAHHEYVIMTLPSFVVVYGIYIFKSKHYELVSNTTGIFLVASMLVISLLISTVKHFSDGFILAIRRYISIGLVFPSVIAFFVPIIEALTGGNLDNVFWGWVGCITASIVLCLASIVIGLLLKTIVTVIRKFK